MKKTLFPIIIAIVIATFSACGDKDDAIREIPKIQNPQKLSSPERIDSLVVSTCDGLFADMKGNYPELSDDELYKAASDILFSDNRDQEANECCNKITEETLREACKR